MHNAPFEKLLGKHQIRDLKSNEVYCCMNGCGECNKVILEEDEATLTCGLTGAIKERFYNLSDVSSCCGQSLLIWNNETDEEVIAEYVFSKVTTPTTHPDSFTSVFPGL